MRQVPSVIVAVSASAPTPAATTAWSPASMSIRKLFRGHAVEPCHKFMINEVGDRPRGWGERGVLR